MLTNRINVTYNMENIDADFDVFRVEKANKDYYKYNILDSAVYEFKAAAVQWTFGATALVLFRKGEVTEKQFKESIMKEYEDVKIQKIDLFDSEQCSNCFYFENRLLAQLLINSMRTPKHEAFMYNNLTGKLFYHDPSWKHKDKLTGKVNFIRFLEIVIDPGMYLNLEHKTFKRYDRESNGLYVIDSKTGEFRKKLKTDTNVITYKEGSLPHNHFRVDNFDITDNNPYIVGKIEAASASPFTGNLINKYFTIQRVHKSQKGKSENKITAFDCPAWVLMELLSFGDFIRFYEYYYGLKGGMPVDISMINLVKSLRNGCAHNNCIIADLNPGSSIAPAAIYRIIKTMPDINKNQRQKKLSCRAVLEFVSMLCVYNMVVSEKVKKHRINELKQLFDDLTLWLG